MAISVVMPALEMAQETGKLVSWKKQAGETVKKGELLLEVETDKAVVEIESPGDGVLGGVTAQAGAVVPVGQTIAWLLKPGEQPPAQSAPVQTGRTGAAAVQMPAAVLEPERDTASGPHGDPLAVAAANNIRISPKARRLAKEHNVDIRRVRGTGPQGEIIADDILAASRSGGAPAPASATATAGKPAPAYTPASMDVGALSSIGKIMAERTTQSWVTTPHFFLSREVDCSDLVAARKRLGGQIEREFGVKLTFTDLLSAAIAQVLRKHPRMNASWTGNEIKANADINVGLAMAVTDAVVVGVLPRTDSMRLGDIASRRRDLTERARTNKLAPADITGATFTISNLGMYHVDAFTAIIVPPQAGILAVGAMKDTLVPVMGGIATKPMMTITLSCDHRVLDGARGAMFLHDLVEALQNPSF
ncbi:MAG TPA: dihydrolipoamide acetyltransferase family protein [Vicinamibacterales bacterium]|nr:dihydrolipoamide acetyltransferase family protein [Vicinamibacterales bacterium]